MTVIRQWIKDGPDSIKVYATGRDFLKNGHFLTIVKYSEPEWLRDDI